MTAGARSPFDMFRGKAVALLSVLAIAIQCLIIQTHVHAWAGPVGQAEVIALDATATGSPAGQAPSTPHRHGGSGLCYICQSAVAGTAILTAAPSLNFVEAQLAAVVIAIEHPAPVATYPSHIWRSRAPPFQL